MLWYKAWRETQFRFLVSAILVIACSAFFVLGNPFILGTWREWEQLHPKEAEQAWILRATSDYPYFIWHFVFRIVLQQLWVLCAVIIGLGGLTREGAQGTAAFTLSLPVSRRRYVNVRTAVGLTEIAFLGLVPALLIPTLSLFIHKPYPVLQGVFHSLLMVLGGLVFYCLSKFLSTLIQTEHAPTLISIASITLFYFFLTPYADEGAPEPWWLKMIDGSRVMAGPPYFTSLTTWPMWGIGASLLIAFILFYVSLRITERRDF